MGRKSKGNFILKGHSYPGVKRFEKTTLKDGRAASSAFQMKSPLLQPKLGDDINFDDPIEEAESFKRQRTQKEGETGTQYAMRALQELAYERSLGKKDKAKDLEDQTEKYDGDEGTYKEYLSEMEEAGVEPMNMSDWSELNSQNVDPESGKGNDEDANQLKETYVDPNAETRKLEATTTFAEKPEVDYSNATANEMTNMRSKIKESGEDFDPTNNPKHAAIQNKINELYGDSKRY